MSVSINGTNGLTFSDGTSQNTGATGFGFKNRIINGAMMISQYNGTSSVTPTANTYFMDRWQAVLAVSSKYSVQQSSTAPAGFVNSLLVTSTSAYTVGSTEYFFVRQKIEGLNMSDFAWGTSSASAVTLSFWVRSSLTGTFGGAIRNSAQDRSYPFSFTISSANTWEQKSITIAGDTTGTWLTTNGIGLELDINLGSGSTLSGTANTWAAAGYTAPTGATSVVGTNGATFYITGVQLEKGSTATSFDYRPYGTELSLCQRYYWKSNPENTAKCGCLNGSFNGTAVWSGFVQFPVPMRAQPTITRGGSSDNFYAPNVSGSLTGNVVGWTYSTISAFTEFNSASPTASGQGYYVSYNGQLSVNAEL